MVLIYLFVYGTLMKGFSNHFLIKNCKFIGLAQTVDKYGMFIGAYPFVNSEVHQSVITGEVYEVSDEVTLFNLDELEGHPTVYERIPTQVTLMETNELLNAEIYFHDKHTTSIDDMVENVPSGYFRDSLNSRRYNICAFEAETSAM
jgi:gamma-glutamylaminecyclotransferase